MPLSRRLRPFRQIQVEAEAASVRVDQPARIDAKLRQRKSLKLPDGFWVMDQRAQIGLSQVAA